MLPPLEIFSSRNSKASHNLPCASSSRWMWMAGSAAAAVGGGAVDAGTVQITLTGEQVSTGNNTYTGDLTNNGTNDVPDWAATTGTYYRGTLSAYVRNRYEAFLSTTSGRFAYAARQQHGGSQVVGFSGSFARAGSDIDSNPAGDPASARSLVPVTFSDPRINGGATTNGFADIHAFNNSEMSHTVQIVRTVFDESSTVQPGGVVAGGADTEWVPPVPEIELTGNGNTIISGDATPQEADGTDFGIGEIGSSAMQTFPINNTGEWFLNVGSIGNNSPDFLVGGLSQAIAAGDFLDIVVTFSPTSVGTKNATITINSDDADEAAYTFGVIGIGIPAVPPAPVASTSPNLALSKSFNNKIKKLKKKFKKAKSSGNSAKAKKIKGQIKKFKKKLAAL